MTHRSRLTAVLVDVPRPDFERATAFWNAALGKDGEPLEKHPEYAWLGQPTPGIGFMVQAVDEPAPRAHFDLETDDVEAEVTRLTSLGATEVGRHHTWVVMRDPVGTVFCVVQIQDKDSFAAHATTWD
jgi:predicted enzyme related to lactoylglutathione lyase